MNNTDIITHLRNREYMGGIDRDELRIKQTNEVFTPTKLVQECLTSFPDQLIFSSKTKTILDPACGDGQFLSEALIRKLENGIEFETALSTIYGVDLMPDNVELCRERLLCGREDLRHIVEQNIVCADALRYHYRFDNSYPYDDELKQQQQEELFESLFE
jgi:type I restriction-modification system DNA methylase subunit|tara:strand:+ start:3835 stop:4314 length:480 start_codon:yes stop_codon:yes gene_type:complete